MAEKTSVVGKIIWHDLITADIEKALVFYKDLFNWEYKETDVGLGSSEKYHMIQIEGKSVGGFRSPVLDNIPSHWIAYTTVENVDESAEQVKKLGGEIKVGPMDIPNAGRFAVAIDPQGAAIDIYKSAVEESSEKEKPQIGGFCWDECVTDDPLAAKEFYSKIFGWSFKETDMGGMGTYLVASRGEYETAGIMQKPPGVPAPPHWLTYVFVENLEASTKKAVDLGGKIMLPPMPVPNVGKISIIQDCVGGTIGLFSDPVKKRVLI